jgi:hypothetical protein
VITGSEPGVVVAERLQALLGQKERNDDATAACRRNKWEMQERVRILANTIRTDKMIVAEKN